MSSRNSDDFAGEGRTSRFQPSPDVVYNNVEGQTVLVHMKTNKIYELNRTGARFWELLCAHHDRVETLQLMLQEFDVDSAVLGREMEDLLILLVNENLVVRTS